jgi:hypothetical protein
MKPYIFVQPELTGFQYQIPVLHVPMISLIPSSVISPTANFEGAIEYTLIQPKVAPF